MLHQSSSSLGQRLSILAMKTGAIIGGSVKSFSTRNVWKVGIAAAIGLTAFVQHCDRADAQGAESTEAVGQEASPNQWTNPQGKVVEADFVRMDGKAVVLKLKSNGSEVKVPGNSLSLESYLQAVKLAHPENFSKPVPEAKKAKLADINFAVDFTVNDIVNTPYAQESTIDQCMATLERELERFNMFAMWHLLSPKLQSDISAAFADRANAMSPALRSEMQTTLKMVHGILRDKGTMILELPEIKGDPSVQARAQEFIPFARHFFEGLSRDDLWQASQFQSGNFPRWLAEVSFVLTPILREMERVQSTDPAVIKMFSQAAILPGTNPSSQPIPRTEDDLDTYSMQAGSLTAPAGEPFVPALKLDIIYSVISQTADSAEVDLQLNSTEKPVRLSFAKENGLWYCKTWSDAIQQRFDQSVRPELNKPMDSMALSAVLIALNKGLLLTLQNAQSPQAFSQAVQDSMQMAIGLVGPALQGLGTPGQPNTMLPMTPTVPSPVTPTQPTPTPAYDPETDPELAP